MVDELEVIISNAGSGRNVLKIHQDEGFFQYSILYLCLQFSFERFGS